MAPVALLLLVAAVVRQCGALALGGGSYVALATPMDARGLVDHGALRSILEWHADCGTAGIVALGTTGEASTISLEERTAVLRTARDVLPQIPLVVGTGAIDPKSAIDLGRRAIDSGADAQLVVTPYYVKPTQRGLIAHFEAIADAVDLPMLLYNVPGRTGCDMLPATVAHLSAHARIVGCKEATGDLTRVAQLRAACGDGFLLYSGDDASAREFVTLGGDGVISVTANVAPREMQTVMQAANDPSRLDAARELDATLKLLHRDLFCEANPIPVKWALTRAGRYPSGIRLPLTELSPQFHSAVEDAMRAAGISL